MGLFKFVAVGAVAVGVYFLLHAPLGPIVARSGFPDASDAFIGSDWRNTPAIPWTNGTVDTAVVKFTIDYPQEQLDDLQHRLEHYRGWESSTPLEHHDEDHWTWGIPQENLTDLVNHWKLAYDWRRFEAQINQDLFATGIDGLRIVFKHLEPAADAVRRSPVILLHGWPGSITEFSTLQEMMRADGHPVVVPCIPGYGYSTAPQREGFDVVEAAIVFHKLMERLGYDNFMIQGGDWGGLILEAMVHVDPSRVVGAHTNFPLAICPRNIAAILDTLLYGTELDRKHLNKDLANVIDTIGYMVEQATRPETLGAALSDSPVGLLAWIVEKFHGWSDSSKPLLDKFMADELITNVMMYWTSNSFTSSARFYKENFGRRDARTALVVASEWPASVPAAVSMFPFELHPPAPRIAADKYKTSQVDLMEKGGHFAAAEEPELLYATFKKFADVVEL